MNRNSNIIKDQKGLTLVTYSLILSVLLGFTALVTDVGLIFMKKQSLSNAVDAAALAAAQDVVFNTSGANKTAAEYLKKNGVDTSLSVINVQQSKRSVEVRSTNTVPLFFARIFGFTNTDVHASAKAAAYPISALAGVRPLAVEQFAFEYGVQYVLKEGAGSSYSGNFGPVALGGTGSNNYRDNLKFGYKGMLRIGDRIDTETGNMPSPTKEGIDYLMNQCSHSPKCTISQYAPSCPRMIPVPIVDSLDLSGRKKAEILGFAMFLLSNSEIKGGKMEVTGWFIRHTTSGEISESNADFGLYAVKLIK